MSQRPVASARSLLFVPGSRMDRFDKALSCGADCVIVDLEDAVAPEQKAAAREQVGARLLACDAAALSRALVRINAADAPWFEQDVHAAAGWVARGLGGVMIPKADPKSLATAMQGLGTQALLIPLVESLPGIDAVDEVAHAQQVVRLAFGHLDFQLDLGLQCSPGEPELLPVRYALVAASRRAQLAAPIDGVTTDTGDEDRLAGDARRARAFGFGAKLCIHPAQVARVNESFSPSAAEVDWARRVVDAASQHGGRAFSLDGRMVDLPVVRGAQRVLDQAKPR